MVNEKAGEKISESKKWVSTSFFISEPFKKMWNQFNLIVNQENSESFLTYCSQIEKIDPNSRNFGKRALVIRWLISDYVLRRIKNERKNNIKNS